MTTIYLSFIAICFAAFAAWVTHVVVCIKAASWLFLAIGALVPPVGVINGVGVWFGAW